VIDVRVARPSAKSLIGSSHKSPRRLAINAPGSTRGFPISARTTTRDQDDRIRHGTPHTRVRVRLRIPRKVSSIVIRKTDYLIHSGKSDTRISQIARSEQPHL